MDKNGRITSYHIVRMELLDGKVVRRVSSVFPGQSLPQRAFGQLLAV